MTRSSALHCRLDTGHGHPPRGRKAAAILLAIAGLVWAGRGVAADCKGALSALGAEAMQMSFDDFDQGARGWRSLGDAGCFAEAALLIERYSLTFDSRYRLLKWHLAQMHAAAGNTVAALVAAESSLNPVQEQLHPDFDWNSYVRATIAFLKKDPEAFAAHRAALKKATAANAANAPNDAVLDRLAGCFGKPYAEAYGCPAP